MLAKMSRILLILITIIIFSVYFPKFYWSAISQKNALNSIFYSPVLEDFLIIDFQHDKYYDANDNVYTREETDKLLPFTYFRLLASKGLLPDSLNGKKIDIEEIRQNAINFRISPADFHQPQIPLYPLFESKPERLKLEIPDEFFRIENRMEFITCKTNEIDETMSKMFTDSLISQGFSFPAKKCFGNPSVRKLNDEGYFIFDANDDLYHIKKVNKKPSCKIIKIPENIKITKIFVKEYQLNEFYAFVITEESKLYLLMYNTYIFLELPVNNYNYAEDILKLSGNIFYRMISIYKKNQQNVYVTNRNYEVIDSYEEKLLNNQERQASLIASYIFPFELKLKSENSKYIDFYFSQLRFSSVYLNILYLLITIFIFNRKKIKLYDGIVDYLIVFCTGIYGFIAINIFSYEE